MKIAKFPLAKRGLGVITLAVLGMACSSWVIAQDGTTGPYIGGNLGSTKAKFSRDPIITTLSGQGFGSPSSDVRNYGTGFKAFGGYQLNRNFAIEGGYFDLGKSSYTVNTAPLGIPIPTGNFSGNTKVTGLNLDLVGIAPLTEQFSVFGRVGAAFAKSRANFSSTGALPAYPASSNRSDTNIKVGLGIQYAITEALAVRAEFERYRINDPVRNSGHIDMASVGLVYRFGPKVQTPVAQAYVPVVSPPPAPVYVAPPPPPSAPVVVAPAPAPQPAYEAPVRPAKQGRN